MDEQRIDMYIMANQKYLPSEKILFLRERLRTIDENKWIMLSTVELKDPTIYLILSVFLGNFGIDRFMLGDIGMGILKLLTGGLCGVLTVVDWFTTIGRVKEENFNSIMMLL